MLKESLDKADGARGKNIKKKLELLGIAHFGVVYMCFRFSNQMPNELYLIVWNNK